MFCSSFRPEPGSLKLTLSNSSCLVMAGRNSASMIWPTLPDRSRKSNTIWAESPQRRSSRRHSSQQTLGQYRLTRAVTRIMVLVALKWPCSTTKPGHQQQNHAGQQPQEQEQRPIERLAAIALELGPGIAAELPFHARLVELLHQVDLDQAHEHQAFLNQGELIGRPERGEAALLAKDGRHLSADEPDQHGEEQERQGQPEIDQHGEEQEQAELDRLAEVDGQPGEQAIVDRFEMARGDVDGLGGTQGAKGEGAQAEGVMIDPAPQLRDGLDDRPGRHEVGGEQGARRAGWPSAGRR